MNPHINKLKPKIIFWGGTGQAKVVRPIVEYFGAKVVAVFDDTPDLPPPFPDVPLYQGWSAFIAWVVSQDRASLGFCITIGNPHGRARLQLHDRLAAEGLAPMSVAHHTAWIAENANVGIGCQILAGAIVGAEARLGRECIVNTKASIDHECILGDGVEVGPGATLCGLVRAGVNATIYAGAVVRPRIAIGADSIVGAGAAVVRDVPDGAMVVGVPARQVSKRANI